MLRNLIYRFKMASQRFMQGRYGTDRLNMFILIVGIILEVLATITKVDLLYFFALLFILVGILRTISKNISKRYSENQKYLQFLSMLKVLKTHHIYKCPSCKQKIRVPRKGGKKVEIRCPKCGQTFIKVI